MTRLLTLLIPCLTLAAFLGLAQASYAKYPPPTAVTSAEKRAMAARHASLPVVLWKHDPAAEALARVYGITSRNMNSYREWW